MTPTVSDAHGIFVTGTDTGVGKTLVSAALLRGYAAAGVRAIGMKPVASGARPAWTVHPSEDVELLAAASNVRAPMDVVNPYCFSPAIAPHLAAAEAGVEIALGRIRECFSHLRSVADRVVVEGAGGFLVPLGRAGDWGDVACALELPVLLIVGMRLGCLNHALLTAEAISARGLRLAAWIANAVDPAMERFEDNVETLRARLPAPLAATVRCLTGAERDRLALRLESIEASSTQPHPT